MKIQKITTENFMKVKFAEVNFDDEGNLIIIGGDNGQGKTSFLNSIETLLGGTRNMPSDPIRKGSEKASIVAELKSEDGDPYEDLIVERTILPNKKTSLKVKSKTKKGAKYSQSMLFEIIGALAFDPLAFKNMDMKAQVDHLKDTFKIDFSDLEKDYKESFLIRTDLNREIKSLEAYLDAKPIYEDVPSEVVSVVELSTELEEARLHNVSNQNKLDQLEGMLERENKIVEESQLILSHIQECKQKIKNLENDFKENEESTNILHDDIINIKKIIAKSEDKDLEEFREKIKNSEEINEKIRSNIGRKEHTDKVKEKCEAENKLTKKLEKLKADKKDLLEKANFPVKGLGFNETGVVLNDLPFKQASGAEQLKTSIALAIAANPNLKVFLIRDGSLLDKKSVKLIAKMAEKADCQVLIEMVGEDSGMTIVFEDGEIKQQSKTKTSKAKS